MQTVHRQFGRLRKRSADESQVSVLLKDFEEVDVLLTKITDASRAWRESWSSILATQHRLVNEFEGMYAPIPGAADGYHGHQPVETPETTMARTVRLTEEYQGLKRDMMEEVMTVDERLINPALNARDSLSLMRKTIKKREDRKLDFERYQSRVETGRKKTKRSDRDDAALSRAEADLARAREEYNAADDNLRHSMPPLINAAFSLLPELLAVQIRIQNTLLAHFYTMLHNYCSDENFPNPAPPMDEVIRRWGDDFKSVKVEMESIGVLANGKSLRLPTKVDEPSVTLNGYARNSNSRSPLARLPSSSPGRALHPPSPDIQPKIAAAPSPASSLRLDAPPIEPAGVSSPPSEYQTPAAYAPAAPRADYFSRDRQKTTTPGPASASNAMCGNLSAAIAAKKKAPPPPPPSRIPSNPQALFVTALYDFAGQGEGDLVFREGDRIKVTKKSESTDDWWQGELRGVAGSFPANYCE